MKNGVENLSFEEALAELEKIVKELQAGGCPLSKAIEYYDKGMILKKRCDDELEKANGTLKRVIPETGEQVAFEA